MYLIIFWHYASIIYIGILNKRCIIRLYKIKDFKKIKKIDLIKIDTEGHEFNVIKGMGNLLKKTNLILFEHHYDNSLIKGYDFNKINKYLVSNNYLK